MIGRSLVVAEIGRRHERVLDPTARSRHSHLPLDRPDLLAGLRAEAADGGLGLSVPALAARVPDSFLAAFGEIGAAYVAEVHRFAKANGIPVFHFAKGEDKEAIARPKIEAAAAAGGDGRVVLIGIAQEKAPVWRSWKAKGQEHVVHPHMEWGRQMAFVNHFYFYLWDPEWGGAFWKTNAYAPYPIWIWLNGHEWAKRQCEKAGIGYTAVDNGFASCDETRGRCSGPVTGSAPAR